MKVIRTLTFKSLSGKKLSLPLIVKLKTTFHILKLPTIEFFQTLLYLFFPFKEFNSTT
eukprot:UN20539